MLMPSVLRKLESIPSRLNVKHWKAFSFVNNGTFLIEFRISMLYCWYQTNTYDLQPTKMSVIVLCVCCRRGTL